MFKKERTIMSEKRRDNKNRILHNGEIQKADGRYRFKYQDINGKPTMCTVGDWTRMILHLKERQEICR